MIKLHQTTDMEDISLHATRDGGHLAFNSPKIFQACGYSSNLENTFETRKPSKRSITSILMSSILSWTPLNSF